MGKFAVVVMLPDPEDEDDPNRVDFQSREFDSWEEIGKEMARVDELVPNWRLVSFCHVEDLPLLMEPPEESAPSP